MILVCDVCDVCVGYIRSVLVLTKLRINESTAGADASVEVPSTGNKIFMANSYS